MAHDGCGFHSPKVKIGAEKSDSYEKADIFNGSKIRKSMKDRKFTGEVTPFEMVAQDSFTLIVLIFLGLHTVGNFADLINNTLTAY